MNMGEQRLLFPTEAGLLLLVHLREEEDTVSSIVFVCFLFLAGFFIDDLGVSVLYQCFIFN